MKLWYDAINFCTRKLYWQFRPTDNKKLSSCCCDSRSYCICHTTCGKITGKQSTFGYKFANANGWYARSDSTDGVYERTQTLSTQTWPLSVTAFSSSRSQWITERNTTSTRLIVCLKNSRSRFFLLSVRFVAKQYILQQKFLKEQIETCLLETCWCNFWPRTPTLRAAMHSVSDSRKNGRPDEQTNGREDDANAYYTV